jgi:hypothetical protein
MLRRVDRRASRRAAVALAVWTLATGGSARADADAPIDRTSYEPLLTLTEWEEPSTLAERLTGVRIVLRGAFLVAEGESADRVYASSCPERPAKETARQPGSARCPRVYLGKVGPGEARSRLERASGRPVDVYLTVGQVVPRPFARQFGMLDARDGAWVEADGEMFRILPDLRVFGAAVGEDGHAEAPALPKTPEAAMQHFRFLYRLVRDRGGQAERSEPRPIGPSSLPCGTTEIIVETTAPEWFEIVRVVARGDEALYGGRARLCESEAAPDVCTADFGPVIAGQRFTVEVTVRDADGERLVIERAFRTLDAHPSRVGTTGTVPDGGTTSTPADEIRRLVRVESADDSGADRRVSYRVDLPPEAFDVRAAGVPGAEVRAVEPPPLVRTDEAVPFLIPILVNASPYLVRPAGDGDGPAWHDAYAGSSGSLVRMLLHGLERAAWNGLEAEFIVVEYAGGARRFGPFRLHPGRELTEARRAENRDVLEALVAHMQSPPPADWYAEDARGRVVDFRSPLCTLNQLYVRTFPGRVSALLVTDGRDDPVGAQPRFLPGLWPERLDQLDRALTAERAAAIGDLLDAGRSLQEVTAACLAGGPAGEGDLNAEQLAACLRGLDPGGLAAGRPHRECSLPQMNALLLPGPSASRCRVSRQFQEMIRQGFGGEIYQLYQVRKSSPTPAEPPRDPRRAGETLGFSQMLERIRDQLRASYTVVATLPNEGQDGERHAVEFTAAEPRHPGDGKSKRRPVDARLCYVGFCSSSRSVREELATLADSPIALVRLLAAHQLRDQWNDPALVDLIGRRLDDEPHPVVRAALLESAVAVELKRLQVSEADLPGEDRRAALRRTSCERLEALARRAADLPDPSLVREAARLARMRLERTSPD